MLRLTTYYNEIVAESVRQRNMAAILDRVHLHGPQSRADLTEHTGLNRSTVGDLVGALVECGLVDERAPKGGAARVGRPSPVVSIATGTLAIAANPEVDALEIGAVDLSQGMRIRERIPLDTTPSAETIVELITDRVERWLEGPLAGARIAGIGVAVPGLVRASDGLVRDAPHLHWTDVPLRDLVAAATALPTTVGNDATMGAHAEHLFGAARGIGDVVYLNGGASGIGGGVIIHGMPVLGAGGYAGEFGQNRPRIAEDADRRADHGVLEDEVSKGRLLGVLGIASADDTELAAALASATDAAVAAEVLRQRHILSTALANAVNVLNPSIIVLGGFLAALAERDVPGLVASVRSQAMPANGEDLEIRVAQLAEDRLLIGAAESAFAGLLQDPSGFFARA